jgi:hypothetical protein
MLNLIEAMRDSSGELTVRPQLRGAQLLSSVTDAGPGLPAENVDQIFSAFHTTHAEDNWMGLGSSRSTMESLADRLQATANSGTRATFRFTLPIQVTESSALGCLKHCASLGVGGECEIIRSPAYTTKTEVSAKCGLCCRNYDCRAPRARA